jgi:hypothetical protein
MLRDVCDVMPSEMEGILPIVLWRLLPTNFAQGKLRLN